MIPPADTQTLITHCVLKVKLGKPVFLLRKKDCMLRGRLTGVRVEEIRKSECCSVMDQIRVRNLPDHENVLTSDTVLNHVKRLERNNRTGVDDSSSNVADGREDLKEYPVYNRVP